MKAHSVFLHGYVQVGGDKDGSPNGLGNFNLKKKILFMLALRTVLKHLFYDESIVTVGQKVCFESEPPPAPRSSDRACSHSHVCRA